MTSVCLIVNISVVFTLELKDLQGRQVNLVYEVIWFPEIIKTIRWYHEVIECNQTVTSSLII